MISLSPDQATQNRYFQQYRQLFIVTDHHLPTLSWFSTIIHTNARIYTLPRGEAAKSWECAKQLCEQWQIHRINQSDLIIAIGGGSVLDLTGFSASIYHRGIDCLYLPTTLLAMIDAAIGGKTAINHQGIKNVFGTFQSPKKIWTFPHVLRTLSQSDWQCGLAEMIKHALLMGEEACESLVHWSSKKREINEELSQHLQCHQQFKQSVVKHSHPQYRHLLNLGHNIAHALEASSLNSISHGQAVAFGLLIECRYAHQMNEMTEHTLKRIEQWLYALFDKAAFQPEYDRSLFFDALLQDKKSTAHLNGVILQSPGSVKYENDSYLFPWDINVVKAIMEER